MGFVHDITFSIALFLTEPTFVVKALIAKVILAR
jgi:hypothetical protein